MKKMINNYISIDLGASSGRVIVISISDKIRKDIIHRFKNYTYISSHLYLNMNYLMKEIIYGISKAYEKYPNILSIGIDTWGVDYGYINEAGKLLRDPIIYMDSRTEDIETFTDSYFSRYELYKKTGIQYLPFNTIYQIADDIRNHSEQLMNAHKLLLLPDLIAFLLTGEKRLELTNLSTTGFYSPITRRIVPELSKMGFNLELLPDFIQSGEIYGNIKLELQKTHKLPNIPVIAVATHDTASAIASLDLDHQTMFLSSGSWSLMGQLIEKPIISMESYKANFTNEINYDHKIRFLKNVPGSLIKNNIIKAYYGTNNVDFDKLDQLTIEYEDFDTVIDLNEINYLNEDILSQIRKFAKQTNQLIPQTIGEYLKTFNNSIVCKYKENFVYLESLTKNEIKRIIIVGGGSQSKLLNQMVSDVLSCEVFIGSSEATAIGNAMIQHQTMHCKQTLSSLKELKHVKPKAIYKPRKFKSSLYEKYMNVIRGDSNERNII